MNKPTENLNSRVISLLREIRARDPEAFANLVTWKTGINMEAGKQPFLQLSPGRGKAQLSLVGLVNSILLMANEQKIAAIVDNDAIVGFTPLEPSFLDLAGRGDPADGSLSPDKAAGA